MKVWTLNQDTGEWSLSGEITGPSAKPGEAWALALSEDGKYLASTTNDGRVNVWNVSDENKPKIREYETGSPGSGIFGMCVDLSRDGKYTASGHQNGAVYIFNNDTGRVLYSLSGKRHIEFQSDNLWLTLLFYRSCKAGAIGGLLARKHPSSCSWRRWNHCTLRHEAR